MTIELDIEKTSRSALLEIWHIMYPHEAEFQTPDEVVTHLRRYLAAQQQQIETLTYDLAIERHQHGGNTQ
jgi:hypothetical protein